ncbi:LysM domain/BON superfamily protein [Aggregatibacter aphrophilus]|uniref:LysM domain/BON superfamily protein n=1 Tax=Aggregatibacter aphrophilus TaxID=732 RepID=A0A336NB35_AGGAP|nr:LysM domain/BON superfamily protein [Aggregatibacter aphrophilus]
MTKHINEDNPGVADVDVKVENGVAKISGVASSAGALEKAVLMAGNIIGISNVNIDDVTVQNGESLAGDDEFYVIQKGDTLWKIAEKHYGNGSKYTAIVAANKEVIKDADKIFPGQKFVCRKGYSFALKMFRKMTVLWVEVRSFFSVFFKRVTF